MVNAMPYPDVFGLAAGPLLAELSSFRRFSRASNSLSRSSGACSFIARWIASPRAPVAPPNNRTIETPHGGCQGV